MTMMKALTARSDRALRKAVADSRLTGNVMGVVVIQGRATANALARRNLIKLLGDPEDWTSRHIKCRVTDLGRQYVKGGTGLHTALTAYRKTLAKMPPVGARVTFAGLIGGSTGDAWTILGYMPKRHGAVTLKVEAGDGRQSNIEVGLASTPPFKTIEFPKNCLT